MSFRFTRHDMWISAADLDTLLEGRKLKMKAKFERDSSY
jgi:hypothetical protein